MAESQNTKTKTKVTLLPSSTSAETEHPGYEPDDGPLSKQDLAWVRKCAKAYLPKGKLISKKTLL
jgi:hypothetical protein